MHGVDKARLVLERWPLIQQTVHQLQRWFPEVLIVSDGRRRYELPNVRLVADQRPDGGPLMGIYSGLAASNHEINFIMACDMPYLNRPLIELLISRAAHHDAVVPMVNGYSEPLMAVYCRSAATAIAACLESGRRKIAAFYDDVRVHHILQTEITALDPHLRAFCNLNTPQDIAELIP